MSPLTPLVRRYRIALGLFVVGLVISGLTAFPLLHEVELLARLLGLPDSADPRNHRGLEHWIAYVRQGLRATYARYPFIGYGTDWLAFGHLVIALFFFDPLRRPRANHDAVLICGMIACVAVIPVALICGHVRQIPMPWRLFDCFFGVLGLVPLVYAYRIGRKIRDAGPAHQSQ